VAVNALLEYFPGKQINVGEMTIIGLQEGADPAGEHRLEFAADGDYVRRRCHAHRGFGMIRATGRMTIMRYITAILIIVLLDSFGPAVLGDKASAGEPVKRSDATVCGDLLLRLEQKPQRLNFLGCRFDRVYGLRALVGEYRVEGRYAALIEHYFVEVANMPILRFACCGWDSIGTGRRDGWLKDGAISYQISMTSGETVLNRREDWPRIAWFQVTVVRYLEDP
jgi:hypothetical protein